MYLEISGRRSGKTTRLIEAAREAIKNGEDIVILGLSKSIFPDDLRQYVDTGFPSLDSKKVFVDEFEYKLTPSMISGYNFSDAYICGTPKYRQTETCKLLVEMNPDFAHFNAIERLDFDPEGLNRDDFISEAYGEFCA